MRKAVKKTVAILLSTVMTLGTLNFVKEPEQSYAAEETDYYVDTYGVAYEDLFYKAPKYLLEGSTADYIIGKCTDAQAQGLKEISTKDTATAILLEALDSGESYIFNTIFGISTESKGERMEDELVEELIYEYAQTADSYAHKVEDITKKYKKCFEDVSDNFTDLGKSALIERLQKANQTLSKSDIKEIVEAGYDSYDKFIKYGGKAADFVETLITLVEVHEIELSLIMDLMSVQPENSDLADPLYRFYMKRTANVVEYFINYYLVDEVISFISKTVTDGIWAKGGTAAVVIKACIGLTKLIYEKYNPSVSDIVQANLAYSYTRIMERSITKLQKEFIMNPEGIDDYSIDQFETAYSFYLTTLRVGMEKIAKATSTRMANKLNTWADLAGTEGGVTYEFYIEDCMRKLQSDINSGIFRMPEETVKESISNGNQAIGTIVNFNPRVAPPSTNDYHYYNVNGCQNPYALTSSYGMPNCTAYVFGRAWEIASNDWLAYKGYFTGNAIDYWSTNEANHFFPSGKTPMVGAIAVYGSNKYSSVGHVAIVENTDEMQYDETTGRYYGYYISHSSYGGFTWSGNGSNNNNVFHYDKVTDTNWENTYIGTTPIGFIYIYSGQAYDDSVNFVVENGVLTKYNGWQANVVIPDGVTAIGNRAFYNNANIKTVTIPDSVTSIGSEAFMKCTNLKCIEIPDSVNTIGDSAFEECTKLASVGLPFNAEFAIINDSTFENCKNLSSIKVPNSVTEIRSYAFSECESLSDVVLSKSLEFLGGEAFGQCTSLSSIEIPKSFQRGGTTDHFHSTGWMSGYFTYHGAFDGCINLKAVSFEKNITTIGSYLFYTCNGIESINIPETVTEIGSNAFGNCDNLTTVNMSDNLSKIEPRAFAGCKNLMNVKMSHGLVELGGESFADCVSLNKINIPKSLEKVCWDYSWHDVAGPFKNCSNLKSVEFEIGMVAVVNYLFEDCTGLEQVVIPNTVTTIGSGAFEGCVNLKQVIFPESVTKIEGYAFRKCSQLQSLELPNSITELGYSSFQECNSLQSVEIPDSVTDIGQSAFYQCQSLEKVKLSHSLASMGNGAFGDCDKLIGIEIPKSMGTVNEDGSYYTGGSAFSECDNLSIITFEEGIQVIQEGLFANCPGLKEIKIPDTVTAIYSSAFQNCTNLEKISIPSTVERIDRYAFRGCSALDNIVIPDKVSILRESVFENCINLKNVSLPEQCSVIEQRAFSDCDALTDITIPKGVKDIGAYTFYDCDALTSITIPEGVQSIGSEVFYDCDALTTAYISDTVKTLGDSIFENCDMLTNVTLGASLTDIPNEAFMDCASLEKLVVPYRVTSIGSNAFKNDTKFTAITIPKSVSNIDSTAFSYPKKLTISGVKDSYAQTFANEKGIAFNPIEVPADTLALNIEECNIYPYDTVELLAIAKPLDYTGDFVWSSSDTEIASVTENGRVRAEKSGTATITVKAGEKSAACRVNVLVPVSDIEIEGLNSYDSTLPLNSSYQMKWKISPENASNKNLTFSTSDEEIATVDEQGRITCRKAGDVRIYIRSEDGRANRTIYLTITEESETPPATEKPDEPQGSENPPATEKPDEPQGSGNPPATEKPDEPQGSGNPPATEKPDEPQESENPPAVQKSGDLNMDGRIDLQDAQLCLRAALKISALTSAQQANADIDQDGSVTLQDTQIILKAALKIISL